MKTKNLTDKEIFKILKEHSDVLKRYRVKKIGLFGSYVRGEQKKQSDIDFLVEFDRTAFDVNFTGYFDNFMELVFHLEDLFGRKVELITESSLSPYIKPHIIREIEYLETI
ncbi:nucleotidyltransferase family protein [candidate division KSB1 bacterium]|nr:nucleotidyltransferase family protein [candidate division KSB1 bacterium]